MLVWVTLLRLAGARWPWPYVWILALLLVVVYDPWSLLQVGFWLSFVAVAVLFATDERTPTGHDSSGAAAGLAARPQRAEATSAPRRRRAPLWPWQSRSGETQDAPDPRDDLFGHKAQPQPAPGKLARLHAWLMPPVHALRRALENTAAPLAGGAGFCVFAIFPGSDFSIWFRNRSRTHSAPSIPDSTSSGAVVRIAVNNASNCVPSCAGRRRRVVGGNACTTAVITAIMPAICPIKFASSRFLLMLQHS
jgi:hypothetical protein